MQLYAKRKETIERVFADAKEKHAMRYTLYRGLAQVSNWVRLKFATMNLIKLAKWKARRIGPPPLFPRLARFSFIFFRPAWGVHRQDVFRQADTRSQMAFRVSFPREVILQKRPATLGGPAIEYVWLFFWGWR